jgi:hypothetical protein
MPHLFYFHMSRFLVVLCLFSISLQLKAQVWKFEVGSNLTRYGFTNAAGNNPDFLKPSAGFHVAILKEDKIGKWLVYDMGVTLNQYNAVGDVQNIPFSYQANFIGVTGGIGPAFAISSGLILSAKFNASIQSMYNGTQLLQNNYLDLSSDSQFSGLKSFAGYTLEITKKVNKQVSLYTNFQHLDTNAFGKSSLNFIPSTITFGIKISQ